MRQPYYGCKHKKQKEIVLQHRVKSCGGFTFGISGCGFAIHANADNSAPLEPNFREEKK